MKCGVVTFPGSNCDQDMILALREGMGVETVSLWHKDTDLQGVDLVVLPGGFSYGDYLRSGAIARFSPIMGEVMRYAERGGYVLGVCNGFQILTESGLLPGALLHNASHKFICKNVHLRVQSPLSPITAGLEENGVFKIPIAHGEGRFHASEEVLKELNDNGQVLFRYCTEEGSITPEANPNGAAENIAGITNRHRNVMGMMPHPERAVDSDLGNSDGIALFESLFAHMVSVAR